MNGLNPLSLNMFAKCPLRGNPKTRLQPPLNRDQARRLHIQLAERTLRVLREVDDAGLTLWLDQPSDHPWVSDQSKKNGCRINIQQGDTLGDRMFNAFETCLSGNSAAILVGSDCPVITANHIYSAAKSLTEGNDAVFFPSDDGGYALIGLVHNNEALFDGVDWGSDRVITQTRDRLTALKWRWVELGTLWDVDTPADLHRLEREDIALPKVDY